MLRNLPESRRFEVARIASTIPGVTVGSDLPQPMTRSDLERAAIAAHRRGQSFTSWWPSIADHVTELEPWDTRRWHALHDRLHRLVLCGNLDGQYAPSDDDRFNPWAADEVEPHDTATQARVQREMFDTTEAYA